MWLNIKEMNSLSQEEGRDKENSNRHGQRAGGGPCPRASERSGVGLQHPHLRSCSLRVRKRPGGHCKAQVL